MNQEPHILVESVSMVYEGGPHPLRALEGIDLAVERGEFVSIIGPSGCGKSTLLRIIGGLQPSTQGRVSIEGRPPRAAQRTKKLGFVFQDPSLLPWRNVIDNVRLPLQLNPNGHGASPLDPEHVVDLVGLGSFQRYYPHQLSGGMQQRVALARSFVAGPSVLLMDEPFGALDEITRSQMRHELLRVRHSGTADTCTVLFVTHSIAEAVLLSDRVIVMTPQPGSIAASLDVDLARPRPDEIESDPAFVDHTQRLRSLLREHARV